MLKIQLILASFFEINIMFYKMFIINMNKHLLVSTFINRDTLKKKEKLHWTKFPFFILS